MQNTLSIAKREFASYFNSPVAYIVITAFLVVSGYMFFDNLFLQHHAVMRDFFNRSPFVFIFVAPLITMRLLAEERRAGTIELLITLPIRDIEVILGKFLAAWGFFAVAVGLTLTYPYAVAKVAGPSAGLDIGP